jgi:hypothetical protein
VVICTGNGAHGERVLGLLCAPALDDIPRLAKFTRAGTMRVWAIVEADEHGGGSPRWTVEYRCDIAECGRHVPLREENYQRVIARLSVLAQHAGRTPRTRVDISRGAAKLDW